MEQGLFLTAERESVEPVTTAAGREEYALPPYVPWIVAAAILLWTILILSLSAARFAVYSPVAEVGLEAATALAALFGALMLVLFPSAGETQRLRWVAAGFAVLGLGALVFGYLLPLVGVVRPVNDTMYTALAIRVAVGALLVVGLVPSQPPALTRERLGIITAGLIVLVVATSVATSLPALVTTSSLREAARDSSGVLDVLTVWEWILSPIPLLLTVAATVGALRHAAGRSFDMWLLIALIALAGSQLQNVFWPSTYTDVLTTANLLRLAFAVILTAGAVLELRRIAEERLQWLAAAQSYGRRLEDLAEMKSSFTAMVAHELGSPLAAIRGMAAVLATGDLSADEQARALHTIDEQIDTLTSLTADMQAASSLERSEFGVQLRPVPAGIIVSEARDFARSLLGDHPFLALDSPPEIVLADKQRVGQVLRNLIGNAAKYSEAGAPIELQLQRHGRYLRFTVRDRGYGIHPDDMQRIFDKFGRGRDRSGRGVSGVGLGLYLSRRIIQVHGTDLTVESNPEGGSAFSFDLEVIE
ncbi:MAG TPA: HAMP domain-containing sensor histidine kinase [Chloroflexota bacterium]|nr:HAMP domain-containing sensor histidine kinase [Chloroflexota bacterium]